VFVELYDVGMVQLFKIFRLANELLFKADILLVNQLYCSLLLCSLVNRSVHFPEGPFSYLLHENVVVGDFLAIADLDFLIVPHHRNPHLEFSTFLS
jgi:hypothetical protein